MPMDEPSQSSTTPSPVYPATAPSHYWGFHRSVVRREHWAPFTELTSPLVSLMVSSFGIHLVRL